MPTYSYACTACGNRFDVVQAFTDDALTTCDECSGRLRKLFGSVGVVFKGSGFYRTDSRESKKESINDSAKSSAASGSGSGSESGSGSNGDSGSSEKSTASSTSSISTPSTAAAAT